jgi:hypothetical protein
MCSITPLAETVQTLHNRLSPRFFDLVFDR